MNILLSLCGAFLSGYLLLSATCADLIQKVLPTSYTVYETQPNVIPNREPQHMNVIPHYEIGGPIPAILLSGAESQLAMTAAATTSTEVAPDPAKAVVNLYCTLTTPTYRRVATGSGVIVSSRGVILTNAHVAQFLLLDGVKDGVTTECVVRTGSPAVPAYKARLLYIPPLWVHANAAELRKEHPSGTGERDYALLYITESLTGTALPEAFPHMSPRTTQLTNIDKNQKIFVAGYPAEIIKTEGPRVSLLGIVATTSIRDFYTFDSNEADVIAIAPSAAGEQGTSGGPVFDATGALIGLVVTRGNSTIDGARSLRALTLSYIDRTITEETHANLETTIHGNLSGRAELFTKTLQGILSSFVREEL